MSHINKSFLLSLILVAFLIPFQNAVAQDPTPTSPVAPTPAEVIDAVNALRIAYGLPPLAVHSVLMQIAQDEANGIASGDMGHWRPEGLTLGQWLITLGYPLSGDLSLDGYRSENWVAASTAQEAVSAWRGDDLHLNTMLSAERSDIGAGVAVSDQIYIVLETALQTNSGRMQEEASTILTSIPATQAAYFSNATQAAQNGSVSQYSLPVSLSTALPNGEVYHEVQYGQTLWSIAITYHTTVKQIQQLNNLYDTIVVVGQRLLITKNATQTAPLITPINTLPAATDSYSFTPTSVVSLTPMVQPDSKHTDKDMQTNMYSLGAIGIAALFLGAIFTMITRKKPV